MAFDTRWAPWSQQFDFNTTQSGDIDDWATSAITNPFTEYGPIRVVAVKGFVFLFNQSHPETCYRTTVGTGGSLSGTWTSVSTGIPSDDITSCEFIFAGDKLYRLGGLDNVSYAYVTTSAAVYSATINTDGSIGTWSVVTSMPGGRRYGRAVLIEDRIYYIGGQLIRYTSGPPGAFVEDSKSSVFYASINTEGVLSSWSTSGNSLPDLRTKFGVALAGDFIHVIGGEKNSNYVATIYTAEITGNSIGSWSAQYDSGLGTYDVIGTPRANVITCVSNNTLYILGGVGSSGFVYGLASYTSVGEYGDISPSVSTGTPLPGGAGAGLTWADSLITSTKCYLLGGYGNGGLRSYAFEATYAGGSDDYTILPEELDLTPSAVSNTQTFYAASLNLNLTASLLASTSSVFAPTTAPGAVTLTPTLVTNGQTFYAAGAANSVNPTLFTNTQTFYAPTVAPGTVTLTPSRYTNTQTFYAATASPGAFALTPALFTNTQTFYAATASTGAVALAPTLFTNIQTFYALAAVPGEVSLQPQVTTNSQDFFASIITPGAITLSPELLIGELDLFAPSLSVGDVTLTASMRVTNTSTVYAPLITLGDLSMAVPYTANQEEFYLPAVSVGDVALVPQLLTNSQEFYELEAYIGALTLDPPFVEGVTEFFSCLVSEGGLPLVVPLIDNTLTFYNLSIELVGIPLPDHVSGLFSDDSWTSTLDQPWEGVVLNDNRISVGIS